MVIYTDERNVTPLCVFALDTQVVVVHIRQRRRWRQTRWRLRLRV